MEKEFEPIEVPDEIIDLISAGALSGGDQSDIKRYVEWFKSKKYSLWHTQTYWVEHMRRPKSTRSVSKRPEITSQAFGSGVPKCR